MPTIGGDESERQGHQTRERSKRDGETVHEESRLGNSAASRFAVAEHGVSVRKVASDTPAKTASETMRKHRTLES